MADTPTREVFIAWPAHDTLGGSDRIINSLRGAGGVVVVESDFSAIGPSVRGILPAVPGVEEYSLLDWQRVSAVVGCPMMTEPASQSRPGSTPRRSATAMNTPFGEAAACA